jgi:hypothetical protein
MHRNGSSSTWFARRDLRGIGDDGGSEVITLWIERKSGALWAVGRAVGLAERHDGAVHSDDYIFEGYEMGDAVDAANAALESDLEVCRGEGRAQDVRVFTTTELLPQLERWFFGRAPEPA